MRKKSDNILSTLMISCAASMISVICAHADVVTVSSLPGTTVSASTMSVTSSQSINRTQVNVVEVSGTSGEAKSLAAGIDKSNDINKQTTPVITASVSLADSQKSYSTAGISANERTVPVIDAVSALNDDTDAHNETTISNSYSTYSQSIEWASVVEAIGGTEDKAAQQATTSEVGFCVVLSSSPTGMMKDITG